MRATSSAHCFGRNRGEIIFTGGATESCNLAVLGLARSASSRGGHIISNKAEHHAVLHALEHLEQHEGFEVTWLNVSESGMVDLDQLADSIRPDTRLVSIMTANNETGVIQPMREISQICRDRGVLLHSDMVQSFGKMDVDVSLVDAASFAAHKFYGPKGHGFLFLRAAYRSSQSCSAAHTKISGGPGQKMWPASREWLPPRNGYCAIARRSRNAKRSCAIDLWRQHRRRFSRTRSKMATAAHRLANTLNVSFLGVDSETMLMALDLEGDLRLERFGLHGWIGDGVACFAGDGSADGTRPFRHPFLTWQMDNCERNRRCWRCA